MMLPSFLTSAAFWSACGAAGVICGALGYAHEGTAVNAAIVSVGGVFIAIASHNVVATRQAQKLAKKPKSRGQSPTAA